MHKEWSLLKLWIQSDINFLHYHFLSQSIGKLVRCLTLRSCWTVFACLFSTLRKEELKFQCSNSNNNYKECQQTNPIHYLGFADLILWHFLSWKIMFIIFKSQFCMNTAECLIKYILQDISIFYFSRFLSMTVWHYVGTCRGYAYSFIGITNNWKCDPSSKANVVQLIWYVNKNTDYTSSQILTYSCRC